MNNIVGYRKWIYIILISLCVFHGLIIHLWNYAYLDLYIVDYALSYLIITFFILHYIFKSGILSLEFLFNIFGLLYSNYHIAQFVYINQHIPERIGFAMFLSHLSIIVFNFSFLLFSCKKQSKKATVKKNVNIDSQNKLLTLLLLLCIATEFYVIFEQIGVVEYFIAERAEKALMMDGYSRLTYYKFAIPIISIISLFNYFSEKRKYSLLLFFISFAIAMFNSILSASRAEMISLFLPILFLLRYFKMINDKLVTIFGLFAIILFGAWKALFSGEFEVSFDSEFNTWYNICDNVLRTNDYTLLYGKSYLVTLYNCIIPFTDSHTLSTWYLEKYEWDVLVRGGGRGFSAVLEAYMNFGFFGIFIVYGFYGWLISRLNTKSSFNIIVYIIVMTSLFQFFRSESYSLWKNMMWFKIYPLVFIFFFSSKPNKSNKALI